MAGPISLDAETINPVDYIAYKDDDGNWRAGPDAKGYEKGQFVDSTYARQARSQRQRTNLIKANMRKQEMSESEARKFVNEKLDELDDAKDEGDEDRISDIRQQLHGS